jgi:hypothetical protein
MLCKTSVLIWETTHCRRGGVVRAVQCESCPCPTMWRNFSVLQESLQARKCNHLGYNECAFLDVDTTTQVVGVIRLGMPTAWSTTLLWTASLVLESRMQGFNLCWTQLSSKLADKSAPRTRQFHVQMRLTSSRNPGELRVRAI